MPPPKPHRPWQTLPLFNRLSSAEQDALDRQTIELPFTKGEFIFRQGDPAEWFHIVKEGTVKCVKSTPEGREVTLKVLRPGDLFCCEASAFAGSPHPGCAQAMEPTTILKIHRKTLLDVIERNPRLAIEIIQYLGDRLREVQEQAKAFALDRAEQRVASLLVDLAKKAGVSTPDGIRLTIRLTQQDLADMAGLTLETTSRIFSRFKKARWISRASRYLVIHDLPALTALANHSAPS